MIPLTLAEVAGAVGGVVQGCDGSEVVSGSVEFDSRRVGPGGLFVAVPGEQVDGHDFAAAALAVLRADEATRHDAAVAAMDRRTAARVVRFGRSAVALELGATPAGIAAVLGRYRPVSRWRLEVTDCADGVTVVNDAYNANPGSVAAALRTLVAMAGVQRRSWAVLGPLAELGEAETEAYREIGALAVRLGVDRLVVVGEQARPIYWAAQNGAAPEHRAPEDDTPGTRGRHAGGSR